MLYSRYTCNKNTMAARIVPTHFIAIQVKDQKTVDALENVQNSVVKKRRAMRRVMISPRTFHITLMVFRIENEDDSLRAKEALDAVYARLKEEYKANPIKVVFEGIGNFRNQNKVVYADVIDELTIDRLRALSDVIREIYEAASLKATDDRFTVHMTLMKMSKVTWKWQNQMGIKTIDPSLYAEFAEQVFGTTTVSSLQVCSMAGDEETGYYKILHEVHFQETEPTDPKSLPQSSGGSPAKEIVQHEIGLDEAENTAMDGDPKCLPEASGGLPEEEIVQDASVHDAAEDLAMDVNPTYSQRRQMSSREKTTAARRTPTHFIAIQVKDQKTVDALENVQNSVVKKRRAMRRVMTSPKKFHITLMVFRIDNEDDVLRAKEALDAAHALLKDEYEADPIKVAFQGTNNFKNQNKIVYADIKDALIHERLKKLSDVLRECYEAASLKATDDRFTPHLTLMKMLKTTSKWRQQTGIKIIVPSLYAEFAEEEFGATTVDSLQVCSMDDDNEETGYYEILHEVHFHGTEHTNPTCLPKTSPPKEIVQDESGDN
ncbi:uncharacterized protein LOC135501551 isoform X2 [Lineus longissimus]|uniref:uncharacterized protein LOC135501551 isoform X2 n=2 Tax=Lineus longissimus TaxID=88925 RepID=UPI00315C6E06